MFTTEAYANAPGIGGFDFMGLMPIAFIFVIFYFLILRPQQKKMKEQQKMLSELRKGDRVITAGGLIGVIAKITSDQEVLLEIAENVRVRLLRSTIQQVMSKTEPVVMADEEEKTLDKSLRKKVKEK